MQTSQSSRYCHFLFSFSEKDLFKTARHNKRKLPLRGEDDLVDFVTVTTFHQQPHTRTQSLSHIWSSSTWLHKWAYKIYGSVSNLLCPTQSADGYVWAHIQWPVLAFLVIRNWAKEFPWFWWSTLGKTFIRQGFVCFIQKYIRYDN